MATEALTETIKTRVPPWVKRGLKKIAEARHLDAADIQREAFREYIQKASVEETAKEAKAA